VGVSWRGSLDIFGHSEAGKVDLALVMVKGRGELYTFTDPVHVIRENARYSFEGVTTGGK